ncbi:putative disease resistance RPP13-like protein 3 [Sesamum alatum]|uniref:Disease resistance RPP13-like protein 3 n=1 Tax=Sesamum alatum TaxID=300844 RepID=A0AAE1XMH2_9LAMI|nr:putative disease resistance RPP13-like protein 3 [Sesamum alatum]
MAYSALVSLTQTLDQILNHHHHQYCYTPRSEEQRLESLQEKLSFLQAFLEDYTQIGGETVEGLEERIRDLAYRAEDIIESHVSDQISLADDCCGVKKGLKQLISAIQKAASSQNLVRRKRTTCRSNTSAPASSGSAPIDGNKMVGFDEDLLELKARLCGESSKLQIISIVGMGGIGKTTLARNIFDDSLVAYHFHRRTWNTVSQDYRLRKVLLALLNFLMEKIEDLSRKMDEELAEYVYKKLKGRTYLIVMDDMWSTKTWDDLRRFFPDDINGSRVLITTRLSDVAVHVSSGPLHQMCFLDEEWSWNLLRDKRITVSKLTKLWVAEGYLKPKGPKSLEELADEHLEDLVKRNLVLNIRKRCNCKIRFCGLHDLLRDLCIRKAQEEEFLHVINTSVRSMKKHRRLKVSYDGVAQGKWEKYCLDNLVHLCQVENLNIMFTHANVLEADPFPASSTLPPRLKKLTLSKCALPWQDMAVIRLLPNLEIVKLRASAFIGEEWECNEGEFPRLKFLLLEELNLKCWQAESSNFPCLEP